MNRNWITPFTAGAFVLCAATGILIFFHLDSGMVKWVHKWLSWALVAGVALHLVVNFTLLKKYLFSRKGLLIAGLFVAVLAVSLVPTTGQKRQPPFMAPVQSLSQAPFSTLAQVARISEEELTRRLLDAGFQPSSDQHSVSDLTGNNLGKQMQLLTAVLSEKRSGAGSGAPRVGTN